MLLSDRKDRLRINLLSRVPLTIGEKILVAIMDDLITREDICQTCISCENWDHENELCLKVNKRPPAVIIANGCEYYQDIPF